MAETIYHYDLDAMKQDLLTREILGSGITSVATELVLVEDTGEESPGLNLHVTFLNALSGGDKTILDGVIDSHPQDDAHDCFCSESEKQTSLTAFTTKLTQDYEVPDDGDYLVEWCCEAHPSASGAVARVKVEVDGGKINEVGNEDSKVITEDPREMMVLSVSQAPTLGWRTEFGWAKVPLTAGSKTMTMSVASSQSGQTVRVRRARIKVRKAEYS